MLFAKVALGLCGTLVFAGAYTFREGVLRVEEDNADGRHVHVWVPAAVVPMALHVLPRRHLENAMTEARPWLPTLRALAKELEKYPEAEFVEVQDGKEHVRIRTRHGKLLIDVTEPDETVHVACPLAMMQDVAEVLSGESSGV
jgi:hypothetical protein